MTVALNDVHGGDLILEKTRDGLIVAMYLIQNIVGNDVRLTEMVVSCEDDAYLDHEVGVPYSKVYSKLEWKTLWTDNDHFVYSLRKAKRNVC